MSQTSGEMKSTGFEQFENVYGGVGMLGELAEAGLSGPEVRTSTNVQSTGIYW